jgi:cell division protein FtsB
VYITLFIFIIIGVIVIMLTKEKLLVLFAWIKTAFQTIATLQTQVADLTTQNAALASENAQLRAEAGLITDPDVVREQDACIDLIAPPPADGKK